MTAGIIRDSGDRQLEKVSCSISGFVCAGGGVEHVGLRHARCTRRTTGSCSPLLQCVQLRQQNVWACRGGLLHGPA